MAFTFTSDVFFSYAQVDTLQRISERDERSWIKRFKNEIRRRLNSELGSKTIMIWNLEEDGQLQQLTESFGIALAESEDIQASSAVVQTKLNKLDDSECPEPPTTT